MDKSFVMKIDTEMLSAYMDNNLSPEDMELVANAINENPEIMEMCSMKDIVGEIKAENNPQIMPVELMNDAFEIPSFDKLGSSEDDSIIAYEDIIDDEYIVDNIHSNDYFGNDSEFTDRKVESSGTILLDDNKNNSSMERNDKLTIGYEPNENQDTFDPQIYQGQNPTCAICSQEVILRDFGIDVPREELVRFATENGWFNPDPQFGGTPKDSVGNILDAFGIQTNRYENASFGDIVRELAAGHRLIVNVDANELWINKEPELYKRLFGEVKNKVNDTLQNALGVEGANHALVVAGINVNPKDPSDVHVVLIDTGSGDYCIEYTWKQFSDALADSHNYIIATKDAAPYQYNYQSQDLEPSGYDSDFVPSLAQLPDGIHNNFSLSDDYCSQYEYHTPFFDSEHHLVLLGAIASEDGSEMSLDEVEEGETDSLYDKEDENSFDYSDNPDNDDDAENNQDDYSYNDNNDEGEEDGDDNDIAAGTSSDLDNQPDEES